jgi:hypothetical protein
MSFSIGVAQKARHVAEFVEDIPTLTGRPEILTWTAVCPPRPVFLGEFRETAKIPPWNQLRHFLVRLRTGEPLRIAGHAIELVPSAPGTSGFVTVIYRSITSTNTIALFAADQVVAVVEEQPVTPVIETAPPAADQVVAVEEQPVGDASAPTVVSEIQPSQVGM